MQTANCAFSSQRIKVVELPHLKLTRVPNKVPYFSQARTKGMLDMVITITNQDMDTTKEQDMVNQKNVEQSRIVLIYLALNLDLQSN